MEGLFLLSKREITGSRFVRKTTHFKEDLLTPHTYRKKVRFPASDKFSQEQHLYESPGELLWIRSAGQKPVAPEVTQL